MRNKYRYYVSRIRRKVTRKKLTYGAAVFVMLLWISSSDEEDTNLVQKSLRLFSEPEDGFSSLTMDTSQCYSSSQDFDLTSDIYTNEILDALLIKYPGPGGIYPRGFLRPDEFEFEHHTNETPGWDNVPTKVIVVPHVHLEPGWLTPYNEYYQEYMDHIMENMIEKLGQYPDFPFTWIESNLLYRWWNDQTESARESFLSFVQSGQIEIASGMWVSPDEATPHYFSLLDQMIEGHYWVKNTFGVVPESTVSFDVFGHSVSMPFLSRKAGIKNMVLKRVNQAVKDLMGSKHWMTFEWRQLWDLMGQEEVFTHIEQYETLAVQDSCGPNRQVCRELDTIRAKDFPLPGSSAASAPVGNIQYNNLYDLFGDVISDIKKKASNYEEKVILFPYGGEQYFHEKWHWDKIYKNLKTFMNYVNKNSRQFELTFEFGTLRDYFEALQRQRAEYNITFPVITGDFYTYTKMYEYWTGYFTTRMFDKRLSREVQESLRAAELFTSIVYHADDEMPADKKAMLIADLIEPRQALGLFMHHQGITGTSAPKVVLDYERRLTSAFSESQKVLADALNVLVQTEDPETQEIKFEPYFQRTSSDSLTEETPIPVTETGTRVVLINSLTQARTEEIIGLVVKTAEVTIFDAKGYGVYFDIDELGKGSYRISFKAHLPPVGYVIYTVKSDTSSRNWARHKVKQLEAGKKTIVCENAFMNVTFNKKNGTLLSMCYKSSQICSKTEVDWITYSGTSGPYTMISDLNKPAVSKFNPKVKAVRGRNYCRVKVTYDMLQVDYILPITHGATGTALRIEVTTDLPNKYDADLAMRFTTNIKNLDFYTDSNGLQMMRRKFRDNIPFAGNIYPMTSLTFIESMDVRMTVHSAQPHGVISPQRQVLDIFVDRMAPTAEQGLLEGATDNKLTKTTFLLELESMVEFVKPKIVDAMMPSIRTTFLNDLLQHPVFPLFTTQEQAKSLSSEVTLLRQPLPCDVIVANLRNLVDNDINPQGTSLTLFRRPISCTEIPEKSFCPLYDPMNIDPANLFGKAESEFENLRTTEMSLTHLTKKPNQGNVSCVNIAPMDIRTFHLSKG